MTSRFRYNAMRRSLVAVTLLLSMSAGAEPVRYLYTALQPDAPATGIERVVERKQAVFNQPIAYPVAARLSQDVTIQGRYRYRIKAGTVLRGRPFDGNFGQGRRTRLAFCGDNEYLARKGPPEVWKRDWSGMCLFDSEGDGRLDEWRPADPETRFSSQTDPFTPAPFELLTNHRVDYEVSLLHVGNRKDPAGAFALQFGKGTPVGITMTREGEEDGWIRLKFESAEILVRPDGEQALRVRVLKMFEPGESLGYMTYVTYR